MRGENTEEHLQNKLDPWLRNTVFGEHNEIKAWDDEDTYTLLLTTLTTLAINSTDMASRRIETARLAPLVGSEWMRDGLGAELVERAVQSGDALSRNMAQKMKRGEIALTAENVGRLAIQYADSGADLSFALREHAKTDEQATAALRVARELQTGQQKTAPNGAGESRRRKRMSLQDFADNSSRVWNNIDYSNEEAKARVQTETHMRMIAEGKIVEIPESTQKATSEYYPDLRGMKKKDRVPILKEKINELKANLRSFLATLKDTPFEFDVNGSVIEARLYDTGINEVLDKLKQDKASMLFHSGEVFKKAEYMYSTPDYGENSDVFRWNYFYTPVQIGEETVGVRIAIRDMVRANESQIYNWGIKKPPSVDVGKASDKADQAPVSLDEGEVDNSTSAFNIASDGKKVNRDAVGSKKQGAKNSAAVNAVLAELQNAEGHADEAQQSGQQKTAPSGAGDVTENVAATNYIDLKNKLRATTGQLYAQSRC